MGGRMKRNTAVVGCILLLITLPFGAIWSGFVLSVLWGWFVVPTFEGAPALGIPAAIGIAAVVRYLTNDTRWREEDRDDGNLRTERIIRSISMMVTVPLLTLIFGYVVHLFM